MLRMLRLMVVTVCAGLLYGQSAMADAERASEAVWSIAGSQVLRLRATVGEMTPRQRVEELDRRLYEILSKVDGPLPADQITLERRAGSLCIAVRGELLVTVGKSDAEASLMTEERLGKHWLSSIRKIVPQLTPKVNTRGA
jgi:hypothetical protein